MSMLLDENKLQALRQAVAAAGSQSAFARRAGITKQHVSKYLRGDIRRIEYETWYKIQPFLLEFLSDSESDCILSESSARLGNGERFPRNTVFVPPIITTASAVSYDCTIEPLDEFAARIEHAQSPMCMQSEGFIVLLTGLSDKPYPPGTLVYLNCREYPKTGNRVVAKLKKDGTILFMEFSRKEDACLLTPLCGGNAFSWKKPEENPFSWIYPIRFAVFPEGRGFDEKK